MAGHVVRKPEEHPIQRVFRGNFGDGKKSRGRQKKACKNCVDEDATVLPRK